MTDPEKPKKSWNCLQLGAVIVVGLLGVYIGLWYFVPTYGLITHQANQAKASNNARRILAAMKNYAEEHGGGYPDSTHPDALTSNDIFRELFRAGLVQDERIFGSPSSKFMPDRNIGNAPDFDQALQPGENHWALVTGERPNGPAHYPLIFENALDSSWPPKWLALDGRPVRGRAWGNNKIIIGYNDGSADLVKLEESGDSLTLPKGMLRPTGKPALPELKVLDIATGGGTSYTNDPDALPMLETIGPNGSLPTLPPATRHPPAD